MGKTVKLLRTVHEKYAYYQHSPRLPSSWHDLRWAAPNATRGRYEVGIPGNPLEPGVKPRRVHWEGFLEKVTLIWNIKNESYLATWHIFWAERTACTENLEMSEHTIHSCNLPSLKSVPSSMSPLGLGGEKRTLSCKDVASLKCRQTRERTWIFLEMQFSASLQMINHHNPLCQSSGHCILWDSDEKMPCAWDNNNWNAHRMAWEQNLCSVFWAQLMRRVFRLLWLSIHPLATLSYLHSQPQPSYVSRQVRMGAGWRVQPASESKLRASCFI